jgi:putative transcriptional regulator
MLANPMRRFLALLFLAMPATVIAAVTPPRDETPVHPSLTGQLLIAAPEMKGPVFFHTVILMVRHDEHGALGIVINRPVAARPLASVMAALGDKETAADGDIEVFAGGPVEPGLGFVVHSTDYHLPETIAIDGSLAVTATPEILRAIGAGKGPRKSLFALGYAGWGPHQLEDELAQHFWVTAPADPKLVFDDARDTLWEEALARRARDL